MKIIKNNTSIDLIINDSPVGRLLYRFNHDTKTQTIPDICMTAKQEIRAECSEMDIIDTIIDQQGFIVIERSWTIKKPGKWQLLFDYIPSGCETYTEWMVPSVMYKENRHGEGKFPKGGMEVGWSFREDRIPIPSCSIVHNDTAYQAVFTEPAKSDDELSSVKTYRVENKPAFTISVPFSEEPHAYQEKGLLFGGLNKPNCRYITLKKKNIPFTYKRTFYIATGAYKGNFYRAYHQLTKFACATFIKTPLSKPDWNEIATLKLHNLLFLSIDDPARGIAGIQQGKGNAWWYQFAHNNTSGSFLCKSLEGAYIFARAGDEIGSGYLTDFAERIGKFYLQGAMENGLHRDFYPLKKRAWESFNLPLIKGADEMRTGANSRCNGEVMLNYLRLYTFFQGMRRNIPEFREIAERNARFYIEHQLTGNLEGSFGRWWDARGNPFNTQGTNGAHIMLVLMELEKLTGGSPAIRTALDKSASYYGGLIENNAYYGDTLDADCIDKEAGLVLLRVFLSLYERDTEKKHLELAKNAACYILSWMFTYDVPFKKGKPLERIQYKTRGMTTVSVEIHHIDCFGLYTAYDFLRLHEITGESVWKEYARLLIDACSQLINTPKTRLNKPLSTHAGWQPEHIYQTDWEYFHHWFGGKGTWDTCIAWEVVTTLGAMLDIRERFPEVLNFTFDKDFINNSGRRYLS